MRLLLLFLKSSMLFFILFGSIFQTEAQIFVNANAIGANNGTSWTNAYTDLQSALTTATTGTKIYIAKGTYKPTQQYNFTTGNTTTSNIRNVSFKIPEGVEVYGGFLGTETGTITQAILDARNFTTNTTILSGDIGTISSPVNAYHVVYTKNVSAATLVDGVFITKGDASTSSSLNNGGGWYNDGSGTGNSSNPTLKNIIFFQNSAFRGGALNNSGSSGISSPMLINCSFSQNSAIFFGGALYNNGVSGISSPTLINCSFSQNTVYGGSGGAIYNRSDYGVSSPVLTNCTFSQNTAGYGGGMYNSGNKGVSSPVLTNCSFSQNIASYGGGGMYNLGFLNGISEAILTNCIFSQNTAGDGGGISNGGGTDGISRVDLINCSFSQNTADNEGGGIFNGRANGVSNVDLINCSFSQNIANNEGGGIFNDGRNGATSSSQITNSIFWGNKANGAINSWFNESATQNISFSLIEEADQATITSGDYLGTTSIGGNNIFAQDPLFIDAANGNLRLAICSPAINAGNNAAITGTLTDIEGDVRIQGTAVDMGVYENLFNLPVLTVKNDEVRSTDNGVCIFTNTIGATNILNGTATNNCGITSYQYILTGASTGTVTTLVNQTFNVGITTVTWTATDINGNTSLSDEFIVTVKNSTREINILGNAVSILDGDITPNTSDDTDFGNTAISRTITYTIENTGTEVLDITSVTSSNTTDFTVSSIPTSVAAGGNATFTVTFTAISTGTRNSTITINNNDCNESVYDFVVEGANTSSGDVLLVRTGIYYQTIQWAVDAAIANDVIKPTVAKNYNENIVVDKNITFTSDFTDYKNVNIDQVKVNNGNKLNITGDMSIVQILHLEATGQVEVIGSTTDFALLSSTNGTALVINDAAGSTINTVVGNVIMERFMSAVSDLSGGYDAQAYHLFSSPFISAPILQFSDNMNFVLNTAYNTAPEPAFVRPFPTFFHYQETNGRANTSAYFNPFISNYKVPTTTNLEVAKGYQANIQTGTTIDLNGTLNNGNISIAVTNSSGNTADGYNLVGNPYPSPIDWDKVLAASTGLENAVYLEVPTSQYDGRFAEYVAGTGVINNGGKKEIASMQGFFVRTTTGGTVTMNNTVRMTTDTRFYKTTEMQDAKEGLVRVALKGNNSLDETTIYFQNGATPNFDGKYDAAKIHKFNSKLSMLYSYNENAEETTYFAINGLGSFDSDQKLPLSMNILTDGEYEITLRTMKYFHSKHKLYLYDSLTDSLHNLRVEGDYKFLAKKGNDVKRFVLLFKTDAAKDFFTDDKVMVYPNPTPNEFSYSLKTSREGDYTIRLFDVTGRIIIEETKTKEGAFLEGVINLEKQAAGLYLFKISDSKKTMTVRIVKE
ncbi:choice-of-anchor D domain-containing protein [Bernardetia sp. ABR2-2B]|uniref:choice-of-anchor D domain-containing protein n=1 Tax=Bernardetia sp. ABR2-2B TaxID=3127472 RepID=UPI0030CC0C71